MATSKVISWWLNGHILIQSPEMITFKGHVMGSER